MCETATWLLPKLLALAWNAQNPIAYRISFPLLWNREPASGLPGLQCDQFKLEVPASATS